MFQTLTPQKAGSTVSECVCLRVSWHVTMEEEERGGVKQSKARNNKERVGEGLSVHYAYHMLVSKSVQSVFLLSGLSAT